LCFLSCLTRQHNFIVGLLDWTREKGRLIWTGHK